MRQVDVFDALKCFFFNFLTYSSTILYVHIFSGTPISITKSQGTGENLVFVSTGARYMGVLFHTFYSHWMENIARFTGTTTKQNKTMFNGNLSDLCHRYTSFAICHLFALLKDERIFKNPEDPILLDYAVKAYFRSWSLILLKILPLPCSLSTKMGPQCVTVSTALIWIVLHWKTGTDRPRHERMKQHDKDILFGW